MSIIKVREKYPVTLPARVRREAGIAVGDLLEASVTKTRITLTPKRLLDRELARALGDLKKAGCTDRSDQQGRLCVRFEGHVAAQPTRETGLHGALPTRLCRSTVSPSSGHATDGPSSFYGTFNHPSLRAKKYDAARGIWQTRVNGGWRLSFVIEHDTFVLLTLIPHSK